MWVHSMSISERVQRDCAGWAGLSAMGSSAIWTMSTEQLEGTTDNTDN